MRKVVAGLALSFLAACVTIPKVSAPLVTGASDAIDHAISIGHLTAGALAAISAQTVLVLANAIIWASTARFDFGNTPTNVTFTAASLSTMTYTDGSASHQAAITL